MPAIQITVPVQIVLRLMVTAQVSENMTLPSVQEPALATTTERPVLPSGYVSFPEYGVAYKHFSTSVSYNEAMSLCLGQKGQLAVIDSTEKMTKIFNKLNFSWDTWVGLIGLHGTTEWITIDGKSRSDLPWMNGEPNGNGRCVYLSKPKGLGDYSCTYEHDYLCEIKLPRN